MTTAVAVRQVDHPAANAVRAAAPQFAPFLPAGVDVEQVAAAVFLEAQRVPQLAKCTPASIVSAASRLVQWGFDIGRTGFLVPFKDTKANALIATPVPGYKGFIELVLATGAAHDCDAREVREGDVFEYEFGTEGRLRHVPGGKNTKQRGRITHFYVCWKIRFGYTKFDVMSLDEVEDIRLKHSRQWGADKWARGECESWYGVKTVIRRSAKQLPQNPKLSRFFAALKEDEAAEFGANPLTGAKADDAPRVPAERAHPVAAASFEEEAADAAPARLPRWRGHPLSERFIRDVETADLEELVAQLRAAEERGDTRYVELVAKIAAELDERRHAA